MRLFGNRSFGNSRRHDHTVKLSANRENRVKVGQKFTVALEENASTGYKWSYITDRKGIVLISDEVINKNKKMVGAPSIRVWTFIAKEEGTYKLTFFYTRPWEKAAPEKKAEFIVKAYK